jgi:hypothetical protein
MGRNGTPPPHSFRHTSFPAVHSPPRLTQTCFCANVKSPIIISAVETRMAATLRTFVVRGRLDRHEDGEPAAKEHEKRRDRHQMHSASVGARATAVQAPGRASIISAHALTLGSRPRWPPIRRRRRRDRERLGLRECRVAWLLVSRSASTGAGNRRRLPSRPTCGIAWTRCSLGR